MKCAANDDVVTIRAEDNADSVNLIFESPSMCPWSSNADRNCGTHNKLNVFLPT